MVVDGQCCTALEWDIAKPAGTHSFSFIHEELGCTTVVYTAYVGVCTFDCTSGSLMASGT
jgi:hypothetical protein